jgi:UDP-glucose 4-epimerase
LIETDVKEAKTIYAANKIACENYLQAYSNAYAIPYTILRICVPYANAMSSHYSFGTVGSFIAQASKESRIRLYGGGNLRRTFTHIEDLCRLTALASTHPEAMNQIFNMPGEDFSLYEAALLIAERAGARVEVTEWPVMDSRIESGSTVFDGSQLLNILQTSCIRRFVDWVDEIDVSKT